ALVSLVSIVAFTMILPTFTKSEAGPYYTASQLFFEFFACLTIYAAFISAQTIRHREYFIPDDTGVTEPTKHIVSNKALAISLVFLLISLSIVVLLAKSLSYPIEQVIVSFGLPKSL